MLGSRRHLFAALSCAVASAVVGQQFVDQLVLGGFNQPVGFAFDDAHRMFVFEKRGMVYVVDHGVRLPQPLIDLRDEVGNWRDHGLLGFALDPDFAHNGHFYLAYVVDRHHLQNAGTPAYSATANDYLSATIARVTRFDADPATSFATVLPGSRSVLLGETAASGVPITYESHGIGSLVFGTDGTLLVSAGDSASFAITPDVGSDPVTYFAQALNDGVLRPAENVGAYRAQLLDCLGGKVLRIDPATGDGVPSNPFFEPQRPRSARSRVWALGLRNPFRMTLRPGTGATDPALGRPGVLYLGDVGWVTREELDVVTDGGSNFGWPMFEGLTSQANYAALLTDDLDAPNPLAGSGGCTQQWLRFQDLLQQPQQNHAEFFPNPCNPAVGIAATTPTFVHALPALDWQHGQPIARVGAFVGGALTFPLLGSANAGVAGAPFAGNASIGGCWHSGQSFPVGFGSCYYHADFATGCIKRCEFDAQQQLLAVHDFATVSMPVMLGEDPVDHALLYVDLQHGEVRAIRNVQLPPPVVAVRVDRDFGPAPLTVQFDARGSTDPLGRELAFAWDFGDGQTADVAQVGHTFAGLGGPAVRTVRLTVTAAGGAATTTTVPIALDNTPPRVLITSVQQGENYSSTAPTVRLLQASVQDAEHAAAQLAFEWRTTLYHDNHQHPEPIDPRPVASTTLSPAPGDEFFAYRIDLTVTDAGGLRGSDHVWVLPDTTAATTSVRLTEPGAGAEFAPGEAVAFAAATTGNVQRVEYWVEGELVGVASAPPFACTWTADRTGACAVVALAVGTDGTCSNSGVVQLWGAQPVRLQCRLAASAADAREASAGMAPMLASPSLQLGDDGRGIVGLRFTDLAELRGGRILAADVSFCSCADGEAPTELWIRAEARDVVKPIVANAGNLHGRARTRTKVRWAPPPWRAGDAGAAERSVDVAALVREVAALPAWRGELLLLIEGTGRRDACSVDGRPEAAPLLTIDYLPLVRDDQRVR